MSVSSRNVPVFAYSVQARHPLPAHVVFHRLPGEQLISRGCNVRFMLRPASLLAPLKRPPLLSRGSGYFYIRACPPSVILRRVGYNYLGIQTIPRAGLSPAGSTALWAAHAELSCKKYSLARGRKVVWQSQLVRRENFSDLRYFLTASTTCWTMSEPS